MFLKAKCPFCETIHHEELSLSEEEFNKAYEEWKNGKLIQNAFPTLTPDQREMIRILICPKCSK